MSKRKYLPTFAELLDRMTICQLKAIFIPENKENELKSMREEIDELKFLLKQLLQNNTN